ncbi:hypothetical protein M4I21_10465 [Cellulophaga sp. 20_2_10]|uniref:hypothetical protein n=1 Tax=Cellulophaga sp. 20_2_10 TaxID=2942476 RepID=UPI00201B0802|nr:hypothetical protein [Cellulophaga sp. 20_2_10]MCL5246232.1 hypothetical protein [Cellulophaga sp. 20_2_10]
MNDYFIVTLILLLYFSPIFYQLTIVIKERKKGNKIPLKKLLKVVKYSLFVLIPLVLCFAAIIHTNYLNYEKPITFDRYEEITFENFRGLEFFKKTLYGNKRFAYVVTSIESTIEDDFVILNSLFHPSRSFVYNKNTNSKELLSHEKYHFKITELFTRKAKFKIAQLKSFDKKRIEEIINTAKSEERIFQKEYDYDTFHSYVLSEQKRYENKIDSLLLLLSNYKKQKIKINEEN